MVLHRLAVVMPSDLAGAKNGHLLGEFLEPTAGGDVMHHLAARAFNAMHAAAATSNIDLAMTDGYRPYSTQVALFEARYQRTYNPFQTTTQSKVWNGARYWKKRNVATAAVPGTSNHGWGLAADITAVETGDDDLGWLERNALRFGFTWELLPEEPWHIRYYPGDRLPTAVTDWERHQQPAPPPPPPPLPIGAQEMRFYRTTDTGNFYAVYYARIDGVLRLVKAHITGPDWQWLGEPAAELRPITQQRINELVDA